MVKNLKRARKVLEKEGRASEYDFFPPTYVLPLEHGIFVEEFRRNPGYQHVMSLRLDVRPLQQSVQQFFDHAAAQ